MAGKKAVGKRIALADYKKQKKRGEIFAGEVSAPDDTVIEFHWREPTGRDLMLLSAALEGGDDKSVAADLQKPSELVDAVMELCARIITDAKGKKFYADVDDLDGSVDDMQLAMQMFDVIIKHSNELKKKRTMKT